MRSKGSASNCGHAPVAAAQHDLAAGKRCGKGDPVAGYPYHSSSLDESNQARTDPPRATQVPTLSCLRFLALQHEVGSAVDNLKQVKDPPYSWFLVLHGSLDKLTLGCRKYGPNREDWFLDDLQTCCRDFYGECLLICSSGQLEYQGLPIAWSLRFISLLLYRSTPNAR